MCPIVLQWCYICDCNCNCNCIVYAPFAARIFMHPTHWSPCHAMLWRVTFVTIWPKHAFDGCSKSTWTHTHTTIQFPSRHSHITNVYWRPVETTPYSIAIRLCLYLFVYLILSLTCSSCFAWRLGCRFSFFGVCFVLSIRCWGRYVCCLYAKCSVYNIVSVSVNTWDNFQAQFSIKRRTMRTFL